MQKLKQYCLILIVLTVLSGFYDTKQAYANDYSLMQMEIASEYRHMRRYELARQHLLLALSSCSTIELRHQIQEALKIIELEIRSLR